MQIPSFKFRKSQSLVKIITACLLIFALGVNVFAQYRGAPVKKERLLKALRSKLLQTEDIVSVINSNGVDFRLTADIRQALINAGARPEVIKAVANNLRIRSNNGLLYAKKDLNTSNPENNPGGTEYNDLLEKAMYSYGEGKDPANAVRFLQAAIKLKPSDAKAYQMLGFVNLYGLYDLENTRKYMRESMSKGGSAVFRVYHDDNGNFTERCSGSLYLSSEKIRFESDDNTHTFETSAVNIEKIENDTESSKIWNKHPIFNVLLKFGKEKAKFRFAPISGKMEESNMAAFFMSELHPNSFGDKVISFGTTVLKIKSEF